MAMCPTTKGHQGQDIRPATCNANSYWAVAAADGIIISVAKYSVILQTRLGTEFRYMHMQMSDLAVREGDRVRAGDRLGKVSNFFGGTPTTIHLHFDVKDAVLINGVTKRVYLPPYTSLVESYKKLMGL